MNNLYMVMDMFITEDYISNLIEELDFKIDRNININYTTGCITGKIIHDVRNYILKLIDNEYSIDEVNKVMGKRIFHLVKECLQSYYVI